MTIIRFKKFNIEAYKPGRSRIKNMKKVVKLSANESALGVSPKVKKIISNKNLSFFRYPDPKSRKLRMEISKKFKCNIEKIICGSGSDEVIQMLCQLILKPKDEVIVPQFSFLMYRIYAKIVGANVIFSKEKKFKVSVSEIIKKVTKKTKMVFLANPNNPTGTYLNRSELIKLRKKLRKNILLVVDDAYFEYMKNLDYSSGLDLFKNKENVFILRTFSKIYGLSSLRVGWGYGSKRTHFRGNSGGWLEPGNCVRGSLRQSDWCEDAGEQSHEGIPGYAASVPPGRSLGHRPSQSLRNASL